MSDSTSSRGLCTGIVLLVRQDIEELRCVVRGLAAKSQDTSGWDYLIQAIDLLLSSSARSPYLEIGLFEVPGLAQEPAVECEPKAESDPDAVTE